MSKRRSKPPTETKAAPPEPEKSNIVEPSVCRMCGSTDRTPYHHTRRLKQSGTLENGRAYNWVFWRTCKCRNCDQVRVDKFFELTDAFHQEAETDGPSDLF